MTILTHLLCVFYFINGKLWKLEEVNVIIYYPDFSSKSYSSSESSLSSSLSSLSSYFFLLLSLHINHCHLHQKNFLYHLQCMISSLSLWFCICIFLEVSGDYEFYPIWNQNQSLLLKDLHLLIFPRVRYHEN